MKNCVNVKLIFPLFFVVVVVAVAAAVVVRFVHLHRGGHFSAFPILRFDEFHFVFSFLTFPLFCT